ncbi:TPA: hypothetical protein ACGU4W_001114 [Vibrio vulnificus]|nr:hypothetical protein [Vibrio vulnificus]
MVFFRKKVEHWQKVWADGDFEKDRPFLMVRRWDFLSNALCILIIGEALGITLYNLGIGNHLMPWLGFGLAGFYTFINWNILKLNTWGSD